MGCLCCKRVPAAATPQPVPSNLIAEEAHLPAAGATSFVMDGGDQGRRTSCSVSERASCQPDLGPVLPLATATAETHAPRSFRYLPALEGIPTIMRRITEGYAEEYGEQLFLPISAEALGVGCGDILCVKNSRWHYGHVTLILEEPVLWPFPFVMAFPTMECSEDSPDGTLLFNLQVLARGEEGLVKLGEWSRGELSHVQHPTKVELWVCPAELRGRMHPVVMDQAITQICGAPQTWSGRTAARAALCGCSCLEPTAEDIEQSLERPPICTTIILSFWQRVIRGDHDEAIVQQYLPRIRADRALPGQLLEELQRRGFNVAR